MHLILLLPSFKTFTERQIADYSASHDGRSEIRREWQIEIKILKRKRVLNVERKRMENVKRKVEVAG